MASQTHCHELAKTLGDYVDGELDPALCAELERHLEACPDCQVVVNTLRKTVDLVHTSVGEAELPGAARSRLFHRLQLDDYLVRPEPLRGGALCPQCGQGRLDYDGTLNLACPACGWSQQQGGCFT